MTAARLAAVRARLDRWEVVRPAPSGALVAGLRVWADSIERRLAPHVVPWMTASALSDLVALEHAVGIATEESNDAH